MICTKHPRYKGVHKPRCSCHVCWTIFELARSKPKLAKNLYPRIEALGRTVHVEKHYTYVNRTDLVNALRKKGWLKRYSKLYGVQTQGEFGPYPWDVEAVLERIASGKLQGSQALWD